MRTWLGCACNTVLEGFVISGPTPGRRLGLHLIRAASRAEAERIAARDPFTTAGHCTFGLIEWEVHPILGARPFAEAAQRAVRNSAPAE